MVGSRSDVDLIAGSLDSTDVFACPDSRLGLEPDDAIILMDQPPEQGATELLVSLRAAAVENIIVVVTEARSAVALDRWVDLGASAVIGRGDIERLPMILRREGSYRHTRRALARLQDEFAVLCSSLSHDFRAPARIIHGFAQALSEDCGAGLPARVQQDLETITSKSQHLGEMIEALLVWSRIGDRRLRPVAVDMEALANQAAAGLRRALERDIDLRIGPLPPAYGDSEHLLRVWSLLLSNAAKFTRTGQPARITVSAELERHTITYRIQDSGVGFEPACAARLFRVFERLHSTAEFDGVGMGLAQVRRIVEWHGGTVAAQGIPDGGASFTFSLPRP